MHFVETIIISQMGPGHSVSLRQGFVRPVELGVQSLLGIFATQFLSGEIVVPAGGPAKEVGHGMGSKEVWGAGKKSGRRG